MGNHRVYRTIVDAVRKGRLKEPFSKNEVIKACPRLKASTICTFPWKHRKGNPRGNSELFIRVAKGRFKLNQPIKYGI